MMFASTSCVESFMVRPSSQTMRSTSLSSSSSTTLPPPNTTDLDTINRAQICLKNPDMFRIDEIREMYQNWNIKTTFVPKIALKRMRNVILRERPNEIISLLNLEISFLPDPPQEKRKEWIWNESVHVFKILKTLK